MAGTSVVRGGPRANAANLEKYTTKEAWKHVKEQYAHYG